MPFGEPGDKRVALLFSDISERKQAETQLQQLATDLAHSDRRKTEFLATLAHELRNPLAPICNGIQIMRLAADNPETVARVRDMMDRQLNQMVHLVNDLLDLSRISNDKLELRCEVVDLKSVVASAIETSLPLIETNRHALTVNTPEDALLVDVDPTRMAQVLSNLLNNAAKYTPPEGRITLSVSREGEQVEVAVHDTGVGIPQESLSRVFDMFAQVGPHLNRGGGLGVGLSLVRRLVELHGGSVRAESAGAGRGSTFVVCLPLCQRTQAESAPVHLRSASMPEGEQTPFELLVVDDNVDAASTLAAILRIGGHHTHIAHNGPQALALVRNLAPELVFLDIGLPGMDGYQVAQEMRKLPHLRDVLLVALTGWGAEHDQARARAAGFDHHMTKPASLSAVNALLDGLAKARRKPA
jgi:CheY-like chemotaxis protein/nitrogen-specific signal transduction histidine kinase